MEQINNLFVQVTGKEFQSSLKRVQDKYSHIKQITTSWNEIDLASNFFIAGCPAFMGYAISENGELTSVFHLSKVRVISLCKMQYRMGQGILTASTVIFLHFIKGTVSRK